MNVRWPPGCVLRWSVAPPAFREADSQEVCPGEVARVTLVTRTVADMDTRLPSGLKLPRLVQTLFALAAPTFTFPAAARRYGVPFTLRLMEDRRIVMVSEPAQVKDVFAGSPSVFHAGKGNDLLRPLLGEHSLLLQDGDEHARARRLLAPAFGRREIAGYRAMVEEVTAHQVQKWPREGRYARTSCSMNSRSR